MRPELLNILIEPKTHLPLVLKNTVYKGEEIEEGILYSSSGNSYQIINGIPRFVKSGNYTASFGLQWNRFAKTQFDSITGCNYSRARFNKEVGWTDKWSNGKRILDAGCGAGRFAEIAAELNCKLVVVDMSSAIDVAKINLSRFSNIHFVQADLNNLPFRYGTFEGFYCIGVLQHTPDPYATLYSLLHMISPGGQFAFTIYAKRLWTRLYSKYWARKITSGIKDEILLELIIRIMPFAFPVTDALFRIPYLGRLLRFLIPIANYVEKDDMTRKQRYEEAVLDTYDMLSPKYDNPVNIHRIINILKRHNLENYKIISERPVNIVGER